MRAAWYLGKDQASRREIFKIAKNAYDARSTAVHTGTLARGKFVDALEAADRLCSDLATEMVRRGSIPKDWDALVMAGGGPDSLSAEGGCEAAKRSDAEMG